MDGTYNLGSGSSEITLNYPRISCDYKDEPRKGMLMVLEVIFHELNHYEQSLIMESKDNYSMQSLIMAEEEILRQNTNNLANSFYNYEHRLEEIDSRIVAINKIAELNSELLSLSDGKIGFSDKELEEYDLRDDKNTSERYFRDTMLHNGGQFITDKEQKNLFKDITKKELLDKIIREDPQKLQVYPVLNFKYDKNGARRTLADMYNLYNQKNGQSEDIDNILLEGLTESFEDASEKDFIDFENQEENAKEIYEKLKKYNSKKAKEKLRDIKELNEEDPKYTIAMYMRRLKALDCAIQGKYNLAEKTNQVDIEDIIKNEETKHHSANSANMRCSLKNEEPSR